MLKRPAWLDEGEDPDYRYSLANERTFLAWIRTSLALLACAVAVVQFVPKFRVGGARVALGVALALTGLTSAALAYSRWAANERAMRRHEPLPYNRMLAILAATLTGVGLAVLVLVLIGGRPVTPP